MGQPLAFSSVVAALLLLLLSSPSQQQRQQQQQQQQQVSFPSRLGWEMGSKFLSSRGGGSNNVVFAPTRCVQGDTYFLFIRVTKEFYVTQQEKLVVLAW